MTMDAGIPTDGDAIAGDPRKPFYKLPSAWKARQSRQRLAKLFNMPPDNLPATTLDRAACAVLLAYECELRRQGVTTAEGALFGLREAMDELRLAEYAHRMAAG